MMVSFGNFFYRPAAALMGRDENGKKPERRRVMIFRQPGCLDETLWAFRPILADG
jgi:hypothetical protein